MAGCFTLILYLLALFFTLFWPLALLGMTSYAPIQVANAILCWLVPAGFIAGFWWGRRTLFRAMPEMELLSLEVKETLPLTKAQYVAYVWLTAHIILLFIWLSLEFTFGQVTGRAAWLLALWVSCAAFLSAVIGYTFGYIPLPDQQKLQVFGTATFSILCGAGFVGVFMTGWQEDPMVRWGAAVGAIASLLTIYYLHRQRASTTAGTAQPTRAASRLDVLLLTNGCFYRLFVAALAAGLLLMYAMSEQFALMVTSAWMSTISGYMSVQLWQLWRHRPPPRRGLP